MSVPRLLLSGWLACSLSIPASARADEMPVDSDLAMIVNAGSVGQPRDENNKASFAVYDSAAATVTINRLEYDIDAAATKIRNVGLPEILAARLYQGK